MRLAWEISDEDVDNALRAIGVAPTAATVRRARRVIDVDQVEGAVLYGTDLDAQTKYANAEIVRQLRIHGGF